MEREQIKKWLPEMIAYSKGEEILWLSTLGKWYEVETPDFYIGSIYVINDKHVEARKAFALGEPIEFQTPSGLWHNTQNPKWIDDITYRPKKEEWWYDIPKEGILCWVTDILGNRYTAQIIIDKDNRFKATTGTLWKFAEPVNSSECYREKGKSKEDCIELVSSNKSTGIDLGSSTVNSDGSNGIITPYCN